MIRKEQENDREREHREWMRKQLEIERQLEQDKYGEGYETYLQEYGGES